MIDDYGIINDRAPHLVADLGEIVGFFENDEVSRGDIENLLSQRGGHDLLAELEAGPDSATKGERFQALSEETFRHFRYRKLSFGRWYPFEIDGDVLVPTSDITVRHKIYAALSAFSRMKMFSGTDQNRFAGDFERLCVEALSGFARDWKVIHFGKGGKDRPALGQKLKDALRALARELREDTVESEIGRLPETNTGDGGIDVVVYRPWSDVARAVPCYFGQCAASQVGWPEKRLEASAVNLERYFNFFHKPGTILFIPLCFRDVDGTWVNSDGHQTILVDRQRLIELLDARLRDEDDAEAFLAEIAMPFDLGCATEDGR